MIEVSLDLPPTGATLRGLGPARAVADSAILAVRSIRMAMRRTDAMLTALLMPIMLMLVFGYLFGGAIATGGNYVTYLAPGVLLTCVMLGASTTAVSVNDDVTHGIIDRFRALDIGGVAFVAGHVTASVARNLVSAVLLFAVAFTMGMRTSATPAAWLAIAGIALILILAVAWLSALGGLIVSSPDAASSFTFFLMLVPFTSSAFVPIATMPSWMRGFAAHQPATIVVDSIRALLTGAPAHDDPWIALTWCGGAVLTASIASAVVFQRRTR